MTILVFLQNVWLKNPDKWKDLLDGDRRTDMIAHLLFAYGCVTGRRIKSCFGDLVDHMIIEEASREIADNPRTICAPDTEHISACLAKHRPTVVLTFGKVASDAVRPLWAGNIIECPHPAARQKDTLDRLRSAAYQLRKLL